MWPSCIKRLRSASRMCTWYLNASSSDVDVICGSCLLWSWNGCDATGVSLSAPEDTEIKHKLWLLSHGKLARLQLGLSFHLTGSRFKCSKLTDCDWINREEWLNAYAFHFWATYFSHMSHFPDCQSIWWTMQALLPVVQNRQRHSCSQLLDWRFPNVHTMYSNIESRHYFDSILSVLKFEIKFRCSMTNKRPTIK